MFNHNLLSVSKLIETSGLRVVFYQHGCKFQDPSTERIVAEGRKASGIYKLLIGGGKAESRETEKKGVLSANVRAGVGRNIMNNLCDIKLLHARLGHSSLSKMQHLKNNIVTLVVWQNTTDFLLM